MTATALGALPDDAFAALAAGDGPPDAVRVLGDAALTRHLVYLRAVLTAFAEREPSPEGDALRAAYALLASVQSGPGGAPVVRGLLALPGTGAWLGHLLRVLGGEGDGGRPLSASTGRLAALAAVAAIRTGRRADVPVPTRDGEVFLPTLGTAVVGGAGRATVAVSADGTAVVTLGDTAVPVLPDGDGPGWRVLRRLTGGGAEVVLDDLDPFRDTLSARQSMTGAPRLSDAEHALWQRHFTDATRLLEHDHPARAASLGAGVTTLVPVVLRDDEGGERQDAAASFAPPDAFGSIVLTRPASAAGLADTLIHEFQHARLNGVMGLVPLFEDDGTPILYSPWRDDPRPLAGLLHGAYAYVGVTDFWERQRHLGDDPWPHFEFARWRHQLIRAVDSVLGSGSLTAAGLAFVRGMRARSAAWLSADVPQPLRGLGEDCAADHHLRWRLHNLVPDPGHVDALAAAWHTGDPMPFTATSVPRTVVTGSGRLSADARLRLTAWRVRKPEAFAAATAHGRVPDDRITGATAADTALARGEFQHAARLYTRALPGAAADQWAGLALARRRSGATEDALWTAPELVRAVHHAVTGVRGTPCDVAELAAWLH